MERLDPSGYPFPRSEALFRFGVHWGRLGAKALYKPFRQEIGRTWSRRFIAPYCGLGPGLEVGVGAQTIAPPTRTILSDAFQTHAGDRSLAKVFFKSDAIPYADEAFRFILSEHVLEHSGNPLKSLEEWKRVLRPGGHLLLFLPHKERTFDRLRKRTPLAHLVDDFENGTPDDDPTHLVEWKTQVLDKGLAPHYASIHLGEQARTGCVHHHVWVLEDALEFLRHMGFEPKAWESEVPDRRDSFAVVALKKT